MADFEIIPIEAVRGQIYGGLEQGSGGRAPCQVRGLADPLVWVGQDRNAFKIRQKRRDTYSTPVPDYVLGFNPNEWKAKRG